MAPENALPAAPDGSQGGSGAGVPCNKIPQSLINPIGQKLMRHYPLPNASNAALGYSYVASQPVRKLNEGKFDFRIDENWSAENTLLRAVQLRVKPTSYVPGGAPGLAEQGAFASNQSIENHAPQCGARGDSHFFAYSLSDQFRAGFNRIFDYITSQGTGSCLAASFGIPGANLGGGSCGLTSVELEGQYWSLGDRGYTPFVGGTNVWMFSDTVDIVRGNHDLRTGGSFRANQLNTVAVSFPNRFWVVSALWTGDPSADLLAGLPSLAIHDQEFNGGNTGRRWKLYRPFAEDNWRIGKNLTLNLGLAWALMTPETEVADRQSDFNPATGQFLVAGQNGVASAAGIKMDWTALEPRVGFRGSPSAAPTP